MISPLGYAQQAYKAASFELPLQKQFFSLTPERIYKGDSDYDRTLRSLPGYHIKAEIQPFLDKENIRKDLIVAESTNLGICTAAGTNIFSKSDAAVILAPGLHTTDKEACHFFMKHEISHIKNNDTFTIPLVGGS